MSRRKAHVSCFWNCTVECATPNNHRRRRKMPATHGRTQSSAVPEFPCWVCSCVVEVILLVCIKRMVVAIFVSTKILFVLLCVRVFGFAPGILCLLPESTAASKTRWLSFNYRLFRKLEVDIKLPWRHVQMTD
jgi:hypothetical protein